MQMFHFNFNYIIIEVNLFNFELGQKLKSWVLDVWFFRELLHTSNRLVHVNTQCSSSEPH